MAQWKTLSEPLIIADDAAAASPMTPQASPMTPQTDAATALLLRNSTTAYQQQSEVTVIEFSPSGANTVHRPASTSQLEELLASPVPQANARWVSFTGAVTQSVKRMLRTHLKLLPSLLVTPDAEMHFGGGSVVVPADTALDIPQQFCLSFGAPLVHGMGETANEFNTDVARLGFHLILVDRTLISFSNLGSGAVGVFRPQTRQPFRKSAFLSDPRDDDTGLRDRVLETMTNEYGDSHLKYGQEAWFLLTTVMWTIQTEHFQKSARVASDTIDHTWDRCQKRDSKTYGFALMQKVHILQERSRFVLRMATAFKEALEDLLQEEVGERALPAAAVLPFVGQTIVRTDLKCILVAMGNIEHEFESHVSMMGTVTEMWSKQQDLKHVQVNTLLSMVATIFLPLTFLCGVYGMNFNTRSGDVAIPLLNLGDGFGGYMAYWGMCIVFMVALLIMFIKRGWFTLVGVTTRASVGVIIWSIIAMLALLALECTLWFGFPDLIT